MCLEPQTDHPTASTPPPPVPPGRRGRRAHLTGPWSRDRADARPTGLDSRVAWRSRAEPRTTSSGLTRDELDALAAADPLASWSTNVSRTGGHLGPNLGRRRAHAGAAPGLRLPARHDLVRHRPPGLRAQDAHRPAGRLPDAAAARRPLRLPEPGRVRRTTWSRTATRRPRCRGPTAWPRRAAARREPDAARSSPSSATARSPAAWPGRRINNIAAADDRPLVIVVNDNARSYAPTIGGLAHHLSTLRTTRGYERFLDWGEASCGRTPVVGGPLYETLHGVKKGLKDIVAPQGMFEDLGLKYIGPVDGHDVEAVEHALRRARAYGGPVIVHAITHKGRGHAPAENDEADHFHGIGVVDPDTGRAAGRAGAVLDQRLRRRDGERRRRAPRRRRHHRRHARSRSGSSAFAARVPRPGRSTSASPSSTRPPPPPGWPSAGCTRSSPSTPRSSTGPSTRC